MSMQDAFDVAKAGLAPNSPKPGSAEPQPSPPHPTTPKAKRKLPSPINPLMSSAADENAVAGPDAALEGRPPTDPARFAEDPRISWSQLDNAWILEREDGEELQFDPKLKRWIMDVDPELILMQQSAYIPKDYDENETATHPRDRKRKIAEVEEPEAPKPRNNTAVWVTRIPLDATKEEIRDLFAKYGVIAEEIDSGDAKIKMYHDADGNFKGEALVVYFRPESVSLAIEMLDETEFRFGVTAPGGPMLVEVADYSYKATQPEPANRPQRSKKEQEKIKERTKRLNSKLTDWDDDDIKPEIKKPTKLDKIVILKHMFTLKELEDDPAAILDIKEDIRDECAKIGEVTNVVLYDEEPAGVVTVRFKDPVAARLCVQKMHGRMFGGTAVEAYISETRERFRKSSRRDDSSDEEEEKKRLERFGDWLETGDTKAG
ncbi:unnamed protein product [Penicillium bialowiezense]